MDFTELTNQIDDAINNQSSEKQKALEIIDKQFQAIIEWVTKFLNLTSDAREFGKTLKKPMDKFSFYGDEATIATSICNTEYKDARYIPAQLSTCNIKALRTMDKWETKFRFDIGSGEAYALDISDEFVSNIKTSKKRCNYPSVLNETFEVYRPSDTEKANFMWTLINKVTPEELAKVYTEQTITIANRFIDKIEISNSALAATIAKATEELKAYYEKYETSVTENDDGSVEIKLNGKTYIGTVKEA